MQISEYELNLENIKLIKVKLENSCKELEMALNLNKYFSIDGVSPDNFEITNYYNDLKRIIGDYEKIIIEMQEKISQFNH